MIKAWRLWSIGCVALCGILMVLPSFLPQNFRQKLPSWLPHKGITLGLDLQGGAHLLLEVGLKELEKEKYDQFVGWARRELRERKIFYHDLKATPQGVTFRLTSAQESPKVQQMIDQVYGPGVFHLSSLPDGRSHLQLTSAHLEEMTRKAVDKSIETIHRRIDETGTLEPLIQSQGKDRIIVQIPGFQDPEQVKALLGKTAKLSFQWEALEGAPGRDLPFEDHPEARLQVEKEVLLTGEDVKEAQGDYASDKWGKNVPVVTLKFTPKGAHTFSVLTRDHIGRRMAIVLDRQILSAPMIESHIPNGEAVITGMRSMEDAQKLALMIRAGALPAPLTILEEKVVGPGLGHDSIKAGTRATGIAVVAVALWMVAVYSSFGLFAVIGITANLCFLLACLVGFGATLTLPGLAGIALTVGMSVDANVLINERIKEELALGHSLRLAIEHGYERARRSIIDSNMTTLIGAAALYMAGTGPIRGFAITMALGIMISLFTAMGMTKSLVLSWLDWRRPLSLKI